METRVRLRIGEAEVECSGEEAFVVEKLPALVTELMQGLRGGAERSPPAAQPPPPDQPPPAIQPPASPPPEGVPLISISGQVVEYLTGTPVGNAKVKTFGLHPELDATAGADGQYLLSGELSFTGLPEQGAAMVVSEPGVGYLDTMTAPIFLTPGPWGLRLEIVSKQHLDAQLMVAGLDQPVAETATVLVDLFEADGSSPLQNVTQTDLFLVSGGNRVGEGPLFFGPGGELEPNLVISQPFGWRSRAMFLNVPLGSMSVVLTTPADLGGFQRATIPVTARKDSVTIAQVRPAS